MTALSIATLREVVAAANGGRMIARQQLLQAIVAQALFLMMKQLSREANQDKT